MTFFTAYQLESEKVLNVVLWDVPVEFGNDIIMADLRRNGFFPKLVGRMRRILNGSPLSFILVKIFKDQKSICGLRKAMWIPIPECSY